MSAALVVTTVHQSGDPRIFERTVGSLAGGFDVTYAAPLPEPPRLDGFTWHPLRGGRIARWWRALGLMVRSRFDVVSVHDPELLPAAMIAWLLGRRVVFDVHENVPRQLRHKSWLPRLARPAASGVSRLLLAWASRFAHVTLAEPGYRALFRREHPVFPNYAPEGSLPEPGGGGAGLIYVGDVTEPRGALTMVHAAALLEPRQELLLVGRCREPLVRAIEALARETGVECTLTGNLPHREAMGRVADSAVGLSLLSGRPNERDSMPTKVIEYLQMGLPVVASDLPGTTAAVAGLYGVFLVPPNDPAAAAAAIASALEADTGRLRAQASSLRRDRTWPSAEVLGFYRAAVG